MYRWVRYEAPVMVCVAIDDEETRVVNVVIGQEPEDIQLARSLDRRPLVYDEHMELLDTDDPTAAEALSEAEDRQWPPEREWESGPDALRFPGLYDPVETTDEYDENEDNISPVDHLDSAKTSKPH